MAEIFKLWGPFRWHQDYKLRVCLRPRLGDQFGHLVIGLSLNRTHWICCAFGNQSEDGWLFGTIWQEFCLILDSHPVCIRICLSTIENKCCARSISQVTSFLRFPYNYRIINNNLKGLKGERTFAKEEKIVDERTTLPLPESTNHEVTGIT